MNREQIESLLSTVIDDGDEAAWQSFVACAEARQELWRHLAEMQRHQILLNTAVNVAACAACAIELPVAREAQSIRSDASLPPATPVTPAALGSRVVLRLASGLGWAAAAALALGLFLAHQRHNPAAEINHSGTASQPDPTLVRITSPEDAVREYVVRGRQTGQVVGEMPTKLLIDSRPATSGEGYDVTYLRQFLERGHVPALYQPAGRDEAGRATLVNYEPQRGSSM